MEMMDVVAADAQIEVATNAAAMNAVVFMGWFCGLLIIERSRHGYEMNCLA